MGPLVLVRLHILHRLGQLNTDRVKAAKASGKDIPGMANIAKLSMSDVMRLTRDLGLRLAGPAGTLHGYTPEQTAALIPGDEFIPLVLRSLTRGSKELRPLHLLHYWLDE